MTLIIIATLQSTKSLVNSQAQHMSREWTPEEVGLHLATEILDRHRLTTFITGSQVSKVRLRSWPMKTFIGKQLKTRVLC